MDMNNIALVFAIGLFTVAMLPLLVDNLRTGRATNSNNLLLALAGVAFTIIGHISGWNQQSLWIAGAWIVIGIVILLVLSIMGFMEGGVAKMMMALLPWFTSTSYLLVIAVGFMLAIPVALTVGRNKPLALPLAIASIGVLIHDIGAGVGA